MNKIIFLILNLNSTNLIEKSFLIENLIHESYLIKNNYKNINNTKENIKLLFKNYSINPAKLSVLFKLIDPIYPLLINVIHLNLFYIDYFNYKTINNLIIILFSYIITSTSIQCYSLETFNKNRIRVKDLYFFKIDSRMLIPLIFKLISIIHLGYLLHQNNQKLKLKLKNMFKAKLNIKENYENI